jgi:UPF0755 protein
LLGWLFAVAVICGVGLGGWFYLTAFHDTSHPEAETHVVIPRGATFSQIAVQLADTGVIGNALAFRLLAKVRRDDTDVRAGEYRFAARLTENDVLRQLLGGGAQVAVWVTIPEGFTAKEIAARLESEGIGTAGEFEQAFAHGSLVIGGARTKTLEGYLFPSTYLIPTDASPDQVVKILTGQFLKELPKDAVARARALRLTVPQVVTVASLIEREAKLDAERPIMAGVYYNRLRIRMPLEVDATIEYALPEHKTALSFHDLALDSPYNSYKYAGLPPTPIANPGLPSLDAAFHPAKTEYLYYVYKGNGHHAFAKTLAEHNANVARYMK